MISFITIDILQTMAPLARMLFDTLDGDNYAAPKCRMDRKIQAKVRTLINASTGVLSIGAYVTTTHIHSF